MERIKYLIKNSLIFTIGNLGSKLITFVLVPFYTHYLSTKEYGMVDLVTTTIQLLIPLASLGLSDSIIRFGLDKKYDQKKIFTNSLTVVVSGFFIVAIFLKTINYFYEINFMDVLLALLFLQCIQILFSTYIRSLEKVTLYTINSILYTLIICIFSILFLKYYNLGVAGYFYAQILAAVISLVMLVFFGKLHQKFSFHRIDRLIIKEMLLFSTPLIPSGLSWWVINSASRYLILFFVGASGNGIFAVSTKIPSLMNLVQNIFIQAWQMTAIQENESDDKERFFGKVFDYYSYFSFVVVFILIIIQRPIVEILFNHSYFIAWRVIPFLLLGSMYSSFSNFIGQIYVSEKKTAGIFKTTLFSAIFSLLLSMACIPFIGLIGAGIAQMVGWLATFLYRIKDIKTIIEIPFNLKPILFYQLVLTMSIGVVFLFSNQGIIYWIIQVSLFLLSMSKYRVMIRSIIMIIKRGVKRR